VRVGGQGSGEPHWYDSLALSTGRCVCTWAIVIIIFVIVIVTARGRAAAAAAVAATAATVCISLLVAAICSVSTPLRMHMGEMQRHKI
jgi:hypothetical protein